jgi:hypothetical protein
VKSPGFKLNYARPTKKKKEKEERKVKSRSISFQERISSFLIFSIYIKRDSESRPLSVTGTGLMAEGAADCRQC